MNIGIEVARIEDIEKPNPIYKYRRWSDKNEKRVITNRELFMANPMKFEDEKDCNNRIRYDLLTLEQRVQLYYQSSFDEYPNLLFQERIGFANHWALNGPLTDLDSLIKQQEEDFVEWSNRMGVLCITGDPSNFKMWKKYSEEHTGFCVGLDSNLLFQYFGRGGKINYDDELPIIMPSIIDDYLSQSYKQVFYKERKWDFENEYRIGKFYPAALSQKERVLTLPSEAFKEIIFGAKISNRHKQEVIDAAKKTMPQAIFKQATFSGETITINTI